MTSTTRLAGLAILASLAVAACGGSTSAPLATPAPATGAPATDVPAATPAGTDVAATAAPEATTVPSTPAAVDPAIVDAVDVCALLTADEVAAALGVPAGQVQPMAGSTALSGNRSCFYRPPGVADGPQVNVAALAVPDFSRPADPAPAPGLEAASGAWWVDTLTGDLKVEAVAPSGVRLTLSYQDTAADAPPAASDVALLVPLAVAALGRLP